MHHFGVTVTFERDVHGHLDLTELDKDRPYVDLDVRWVIWKDKKVLGFWRSGV